MRLNTIKPAPGQKHEPKRRGRGIGSGLGKTSGRGHKGQSARAGGYHKVGFEGGQMPLQRRVPKIGFSTEMGRRTVEVRLSELCNVPGEIVDLQALKDSDVIASKFQRARIMLSGTISRAVTVRGLAVTKGARAAIEAVGGKVED